MNDIVQTEQVPAPIITERERDAQELAEFISARGWPKAYLYFLVEMVEHGNMVTDWTDY